jgi:hypothetical protein
MTLQEDIYLRYCARLALQQAAEADAAKIVDFGARRRERHGRTQRKARRASSDVERERPL